MLAIKNRYLYRVKQKIRKVGNSYVVTIPIEYIKHNLAKKNEEIVFYITDE